MALSTTHYIKCGLSPAELSALLNQSELTKSDCDLLRPLSQKFTLSSNQGEASACGEVALIGFLAAQFLTFFVGSKK